MPLVTAWPLSNKAKGLGYLRQVSTGQEALSDWIKQYLDSMITV